ncbi:MAG: radical SAM protein [Elusimicrobia bacterium]|nr:radical SAM protein [Elusimicrobiota bacterium]
MNSTIRSIARTVLPKTARHKLAALYEWGGVLANYSMMRSSIANALFGPISARPNALYIEGTNICNARCVFCAYPQMERPKVVMSMDVFRSAIDQHLAMGSTEVDLTPIVGDPFVDRFLFERLDYLASKHEVQGYHFYSNVILMKPEVIERLVKYDERLSIFCSFGGFDRETYHRVMGVDKFDEAVTAIRGLIEAKVRTNSRIRVQVNLRTPLGNPQGEFWDYLRSMRDRDVISIDSIEDFDNWGGDITDETLRGAGLVPKPPPVHRGPCHRLITSPVVLADGRVNACACRDVEATLIIGDLKKDSLKDILAGPKLREYLVRHERGDFPEACKTCTRYDSLYPKWMRGPLWKFFQWIIGGFPSSRGRDSAPDGGAPPHKPRETAATGFKA